MVLLTPERRRLIAEHIRNNGSATIKELESRFDISPSTLRRDLAALEVDELIQRVRGGAVGMRDGDELPIVGRATQQAAAKRRIGEAAAQFARDGDTILITGGTTTATIVPFLADKQDLTVITNSVSCVQQLAYYPEVTVIVLGGWLRHSELSLLGHFAEFALRELRPNKVFHGIYGLSVKDGLTGQDLQEVRTDRNLIRAAPELIIMADHTKFGRRGVIQLAPITSAAVVVTDSDAPAAEVQALRDLGIEVVQA
jgi:DeoR family transcriptional regulator, aga operon transcriptional repressor